MDAFDKVRELARDKNNEALSQLPPGRKAIDLVKVLANTADLELWPLDSSDPLLNGALAVLAREDGAIYHLRDVSEQDLAILLAHELGHFYVHFMEAGANCSRVDVDASAASEVSPRGR